MLELKADWFTEGIIDFEHKKYILLAYLKDVSKNFNEKKLYPFLSDLVFHYQNLISIKQQKEVAQQSMPKKLRKFDLDNFRVEYERVMNDSEYMQEISIILDYAIPQLKNSLNNGKELYEFVEEKIEIEPVGIIPINKEFGYMMLSNGSDRNTKIYEYELSIFESASEKFRSLKTTFVKEKKKKITNTFESIKLELIREQKKFANPATFAIISFLPFPLVETFLPIAKRSLVRYISI